MTTTYVLVDGENIDATLGGGILGGKPAPEQRPRWERVLEFAESTWGGPTRGLFFLNASNGYLPMAFVQALTSQGYRPIPLAGEGKVVDVGIIRTLQALRDRPGDVLLASHDGDFTEATAALRDGTRRVGLLTFREFTSTQLSGLTEQGLELFDLEHDVQAFLHPLPRIRIIPVDEFDPLLFL